jgi:hypothetical protein
MGNGRRHRRVERIVPQHLFGIGKLQYLLLLALPRLRNFLLLFLRKSRFLFHDLN